MMTKTFKKPGLLSLPILPCTLFLPPSYPSHYWHILLHNKLLIAHATPATCKLISFPLPTHSMLMGGAYPLLSLLFLLLYHLLINGLQTDANHPGTFTRQLMLLDSLFMTSSILKAWKIDGKVTNMEEKQTIEKKCKQIGCGSHHY